MNTIEGLNMMVVEKFDYIEEILKRKELKELSAPSLERLAQIENEYREIKAEYTIGSASVIAPYQYGKTIQRYERAHHLSHSAHHYSSSHQAHQTTHHSTQHHTVQPSADVYHKQFVLFVKSCGITNKLKSIGNKLATMCKKIEDPKIKQKLSALTTIDLFATTLNHVGKCIVCDSDLNMSNTLSYEHVCLKCGAISIDQNQYTESDYHPEIRVKCGNYDPNRHCRMWVERIQAKETDDIPEDVLSTTREMMKRDNVFDKNSVTCSRIRKYLRKTKNAKFNEHIPLIRAKLIGVSPPELTEKELKKIYMYFGKINRIYNIKSAEFKKSNCPYHPYFIYKIIEFIIKDTDTRKKPILACIHLQSRETLIENDNIWSVICKELNNDPDCIEKIKYVPTNRFKYHDEE